MPNALYLKEYISFWGLIVLFNPVSIESGFLLTAYSENRIKLDVTKILSVL
jgi:hypothetical protein